MIPDVPDQVQQFVKAATASARKAWGDNDIPIERVMSVEQVENRWIVRERFAHALSLIYTLDPKDNSWTVQKMCAGALERPCSFSEVMCAAAIMFTG